MSVSPLLLTADSAEPSAHSDQWSTSDLEPHQFRSDRELDLRGDVADQWSETAQLVAPALADFPRDHLSFLLDCRTNRRRPAVLVITHGDHSRRGSCRTNTEKSNENRRARCPHHCWKPPSHVHLNLLPNPGLGSTPLLEVSRTTKCITACKTWVQRGDIFRVVVFDVTSPNNSRP